MENRERRREILEATLRVLDKHPSYVDEMFEISLRHRRTQDRLFANTARGVVKVDLARRVADQLVAHPDGLEQVMRQTLLAAKDKPEAQKAILNAMKSDQAKDLLKDVITD